MIYDRQKISENLAFNYVLYGVKLIHLLKEKISEPFKEIFVIQDCKGVIHIPQNCHIWQFQNLIYTWERKEKNDTYEGSLYEPL